MFSIERKLDRVLNILYDQDLLHWKKVAATDFIAFAKKKFNIEWSPAEINLVLSILQGDGYISLNPSQSLVATYSLTVKGVLLKRNGGFVWLRLKQIIVNIITVCAAIFTILGTVFTVCEILKKTSISYECTQNQIDAISRDSTKIRDPQPATSPNQSFADEKLTSAKADSIRLETILATSAKGLPLNVVSPDGIVYWSPDPTCPIYGSAKPNSKDAENNILKNRPVNSKGEGEPIDIQKFLQGGEDSLFFKKTDRKLHYVDGYILSAEEQGGESCNCGKSKKSDHNGDLHIFVADRLSPNTKKWDCFIVEITPAYRLKHPELRPKDLEGKHVRISGYLFYDGLHHRKNSIETCKSCDKRNPNPRVIWRKTCWELHPVVKIREI